VVLGHSVQNLPDFDNNWLFKAIYAFHMPLFMFVSGYVAFYSRDNTSWAQLCKKAALLVLPFAAWYGVSYVVNGTYMTVGLRQYVTLGLISPDRGLWFLWVLFVNFGLLAGALRLERWLRGWAIPLIWAALQLIPTDVLGLSLVKWHFAFFALGFLAHRHQAIWRRYRRWLAALGLVGYPILVAFWHRVGNPDFAEGLAQFLNPRHLHQLDLFILALYKHSVPMLGIIAMWAIISALPLYAPTLYRIFGWLGLYTLDIYVTHQYLLKYGVGYGGLQVLTAFVIGLGGSLAISFLILRRNEVLAHIFLGKPYPRR
jgi:fucose 4-O-acetylase-like acetyltransferase